MKIKNGIFSIKYKNCEIYERYKLDYLDLYLREKKENGIIIDWSFKFLYVKQK